MGFSVLRLETGRFRQLFRGFIQPAQIHQRFAIIEMRIPKSVIALERSFIVRQGFLQFPLQQKRSAGVHVRIRRSRIEPEGSHASGKSGVRLPPRNQKVRKIVERFQVSRIRLHGPFQMTQRLIELFLPLQEAG